MGGEQPDAVTGSDGSASTAVAVPSLRTLLVLVVVFAVAFGGSVLWVGSRPAADAFEAPDRTGEPAVGASEPEPSGDAATGEAGDAGTQGPSADSEAAFDLWVALLGGVAGTAAVVGVAASSWCLALYGMFAGDRRRAARVCIAAPAAVQVLVFGGLTLSRLGAPENIDRELAEQMAPLIFVLGLLALPGLVGLAGVRAVAVDGARWEGTDRARQRDDVLELRVVLRRLVTALGAFLTLLVVATGMRRRALLALDPDLPVRAEAVLLYGLVFAVLLGLFYLPASVAVDRRAQWLVDRIEPSPDPVGADIATALRRRADLTTLVGAGAGSWQSFQGSVLVAAPLLTALIGIATSK